MEAYRNYFDLLELPPDAGMEEIRRNYDYLRELYAGDAMELTALNHELSQDIRLDYLSRLDNAYEQLRQLLEQKKPLPSLRAAGLDPELRDWIAAIGCFSGPALRSIRERIGVPLSDMFAVTRIQPQYLEDIESERFAAFRAEVYLRSYLVEYSRYLSLDAPKVLADYMPRYRAWAAALTAPAA